MPDLFSEFSVLSPSGAVPVAVIFGGAGEEHEISCRSARRVLSVLSGEAIPLLPIWIDRGGAWYLFLKNGFDEERFFRALEEAPDRLYDLPRVPTFPAKLGRECGFFANGRVLPVRLAFPALHGDHGEDGEIQGTLASAKIAFVGCGVTAGALSADKALTKRVALSLGIATAAFVECEDRDAKTAERKALETLAYPLFIKPARLGSSVGASPARSPGEFPAAYRTARRFGKVLIEEAVDVACELEVAYLSGKGENFSHPGAILSGGVFYSYGEKYGKASAVKVSDAPAVDQAIAECAKHEAEKLACAIGLSGLSRIDFFLTKDEKLLFNEINTMPGMTESSLYPLLAGRLAGGESALYRRLLSLASFGGEG